MKTVYLAAAFAVAFVSTPAFADPSGTWLRENGESRIRISKCGDVLCGTVSWLKDPANTKSKVGQRVFFDMKSDGSNSWAGQAFNPEDGQNYTGKMSLSGNSLTTAGCRFGGLVCRSVSWSKVN